ncbi:MAG: outer membrane beta-barrel protein [Brumimicrobium sp.]
MKKQLLAIILGIGSFTTVAQDFEPNSINLVGGKQFTSFMFKDSMSQKDETMQYQMYNSFGVNAEFTLDEKHTIRPEILFRQAGAKTTVNQMDVSWKMNYFSVNFGYLYSVFKNKLFEIQPGIGIGAGYMMNGEQVIGAQRLSIVKEESMTRFEFGAHGIANFKAFVSKSMFISLEYRFGMGINQIENEDNDQQTRNIYHGALLGIGISLN